jgi:DNA-damage-inducible protein J
MVYYIQEEAIDMARTSNIFARVEPEVKEQAEMVLNQLGIPMSNAISIFLRQIVLQKGIPFEIKLPQSKPVSYGSLTEEQFNKEIEKGLSDLSSSKIVSAQNVAEKMHRDYGI